MRMHVFVSVMSSYLLVSPFTQAFAATTALVDPCEKGYSEDPNADSSYCTIPEDQSTDYLSPLEFFINHIPNSKELIIDAAFLTPIEMLVSTYFHFSSAAANAVLRDIAKVPTAVIKESFGITVGSTGVHYGPGHTYSQYSKIAGKVGGVVAGYFLGYDIDAAAKRANMPSDMVARIFVNIEKEKQQIDKARKKKFGDQYIAQSYWDYFTENLNAQWPLKAVLENLPSGSIALILDEYVLEKFDLKNGAQNFVFFLGNYFLQSALMNAKNSYAQNRAELADSNFAVRWALPLVTSFLSVTAKNILTSYLLTTAGASTKDGMGVILDNLYEIPYDRVYDWLVKASVPYVAPFYDAKALVKYAASYVYASKETEFKEEI